MVDEAYEAFGLEPPARSFRVVASGEAEARSVELAALRAENAELLSQNRQLAAMVESLTAPEPAPDKAPHPRPHNPGAGRPAKVN
jgi:hypothetical protein